MKSETVENQQPIVRESLKIDKTKEKAFSNFLSCVGEPIGSRYSEVTSKRLSIGDQVSRKQIEKIGQSIRKRPSVGHYYPKFGVVEGRPRTSEFSKL